MLHAPSAAKTTSGRCVGAFDHLAVREGSELLVPLRSKARSGERTLAQEGATSPEPLVLPVRSGKHALERCAIRRFAVRGQHELDRQVEQRTEPSHDIVARHVLATAELDVQSFAEVG